MISPKSDEGDMVYSKLFFTIFNGARKIKHRQTRMKTYQMLKRLVNRPPKRGPFRYYNPK